jgi:hypothetical protein
MQVLKTGAKRLWDAAHAFVAVLWGRREIKNLSPTLQVKHAARHQKMLLELASVLEQMHAWTSRMSARDSRAAKQVLKADAETGAAAPAVGAVTIKDRKQLLRAYVSARQRGLQGVLPPPYVAALATEAVATQPENGGEPPDEECEECR